MRRPGARLPPARAPSVKHLVCMDGPQDGAQRPAELLTANPAGAARSGRRKRHRASLIHLRYDRQAEGRPASRTSRPCARANASPSGYASRLMTCRSAQLRCRARTSSSCNLVAAVASGCDRQCHGKWTQTTGFDALERTATTLFIANPTLLAEVLAEAGKTR